jgi:hypothetical protein
MLLACFARWQNLGLRSPVSWPQISPNGAERSYGDVTAPFIGLEDLLRNKRATARASDLADCERLEAEKR